MNFNSLFSSYNYCMKWYVLIFLLFCSLSQADNIHEVAKAQDDEHELFLTAYLLSLHWTKNDSTGEEYNDTHKAYGLEYIYNNDYSLSYNHFINSRGRDVDVYGAGYLFDFYEESFGLHLIGGYQEGYCFNGLLNSVECTQGKDDTSTFILPMLYYKHKYFKLDLFSNGDMIAFRFNIKIYDLFE